jgi:hypothetical protein
LIQSLLWIAFGVAAGVVSPSVGKASPCDTLTKSAKPAAELSATIDHLARRYSRIHPDFQIEQMVPKTRKLMVRTLMALDLQNGGAELYPELEVHLRNLWAKFKGNPPLEDLVLSYIGSVARGEVQEAKREGEVLFALLSEEQRKGATKNFGLYREEDAFWNSLKSRRPAQFEKITVKDVEGKSHTLFVLMGHPEGGTSAIERFHRAIRAKYGTELYINDDLVPRALGFYQGVPDGGSLSDSYIIIRSDHFNQDFLDFVGFHEGRHAMFKQIRKDSQAVGAVEIQIQSPRGKPLPPWVPTPEGGVYMDRYSNFMSYEENYNHAKDLKYSLLLKHASVLDLYRHRNELPAHRLFDLELIEEKIKLLREITYKTKVTSLDTRLLFEKKIQSILDLSSPELEDLKILNGLTPGAFQIDLGLNYQLTVVFSTPRDRELASKILNLKNRYFHAVEERGEEAGVKIWEEFRPSLISFQKELSSRLIQAYDFGLKVRINLTDLDHLYRKINTSGMITLEQYESFRAELFRQGREARDALFKPESKSF